jgi:uncharacterized Zn-binding protein involved in type VI secretion
MRAALIVLGDTTDHGGTVVSAAPAAMADGKPVARIGDMVDCPRCQGTFPIVQGNPAMIFDGAAAAYHGCAVACGARLIASQSGMATYPGAGDEDRTPKRYFSFDEHFGAAAVSQPLRTVGEHGIDADLLSVPLVSGNGIAAVERRYVPAWISKYWGRHPSGKMQNSPQIDAGATPVVRATLYFHCTDMQLAGAAICACFDAYEAVATPHLTWLWWQDVPGGPGKSARATAKPLREWLKRMGGNDGMRFAYAGGIEPHDASPWMFRVSAPRGGAATLARQGLDSLEFSVARQFVDAHPAAFQALFVACARLLQAEHGHAGIAFDPTTAGGDPTGAIGHATTVDWLTAVNNGMVHTLGGLPALRSELPRDWFAKYDYGSGIVIQAGPEPGMGGVNRDAQPAVYVLPDRTLQRCDIADTELLACKARLLDEPRLTPASTLPGAL